MYPQEVSWDYCKAQTAVRESVLDGIMRWAKDPQDKHVFWLNGLAGTGKSTIAQTFSEAAAKTGILGASFFCSRDYLDRRELKNISPTLARQLSCRYPAFRQHIIRTIKQDPAVASNSFISQLEGLIVGPLSPSDISYVIVVGALDECIDDQPASVILSVLGRHVKQLSPLKFSITGGPEPRIRSGFRLPLLEPLTQIFLLHEVRPSSVDEDILLYLREKLTAVSKRRSDVDLSDPRPCGEDLTALTKSSGLFIFASTLVGFIESEHHEPNERLQLIITSPGDTANEGRAGIDSLYTQILVQAFPDVKDTTVFTNLRRVLGAVVLAFCLECRSREYSASIRPSSRDPSDTSTRFFLSQMSIRRRSGSSTNHSPTSCKTATVVPTHYSSSTLLFTRGHRARLFGAGEEVEAKTCDLPDFVMNRDVVDCEALLEDKVGGTARYVYDYWGMHVQSSPTLDNHALQLTSSAAEFFQKNVVHGSRS